MFIYMPFISSTDRVVWKGGESDQLHYQVQVDGWDGNPAWIDRDVRTISERPSGIKELLLVMQNYYQDCTALEVERLQAMAD